MNTKTEYLRFPEIFEQIRKGEIPLPNFEPIADEHGSVALANGRSSGTLHPLEWANVPGLAFKNPARYFPDYTQSGGFVGGGLVIYYIIHGETSSCKVAFFAICQHRRILGPLDRPNKIRGWYPGHCEKCGLDMTVDSGG